MKILFILSIMIYSAVISADETTFCSFNEIKREIDKLPYLNQPLIAKDIETYLNEPAKIFGIVPEAVLPNLDFFPLLAQFFQTVAKSPIVDGASWLDGEPPQAGFFDAACSMARKAYVQKLVVPVGTKVLVHGDLHGDVHSLANSLAPYMMGDQGFKLKENLYLVFLGDYVDRGLYGLECIYILMRLKIDNPDRVFLVRGNHEDADICSWYGFGRELALKGYSDEEILSIYRLYDILPVALFLGSNKNFMQMCHGGLEPGYLPTKLLNEPCTIQYEWIHELNRLALFLELDSNLQKDLEPIVKESPLFFRDKIIPVPNSTCDLIIDDVKVPLSLGFMWNDFAVQPDAKPELHYNMRFVLNKALTEQQLLLTNRGENKLCGICRAHQHEPTANEMMTLILDLNNKDPENRGVAKLWSSDEKKGSRLWQNIVITLNLCPDTLYGISSQTGPGPFWPGFDFDTTGEITTGENFCDWTLIVSRIGSAK